MNARWLVETTSAFLFACGAVESAPLATDTSSVPGAQAVQARPKTGATFSPQEGAPEVGGDRRPSIDVCDANARQSEALVDDARGPFTFHYLANTPASRDIDAIDAVRSADYESDRAFFGLSSLPTLDLYLFPTRVTAEARNMPPGAATPSQRWASVIYTGAPEGFEATHHGHEVAHLVAYQFDPATHLGLIEEGMAVSLDGSSDSRNDVYAQDILGGEATDPSSMSDADLAGREYAKAGSFVSFLVARHGVAGFREIYRRSAIQSVGSQVQDAQGNPVNPGTFDAWFDGVLQAVDGTTWEQDKAAWALQVNAVLAQQRVSAFSERSAVVDVLVAQASSVRTHDALAYRAYMDGFYCDWADETARQQIAQHIASGPASEIQVPVVQPVEVRNFPEAWAQVVSTDGSGNVTPRTVILEKFPSGWRVTWDPQWSY